ncbi:MAG TPA: DUF305 domain-containing protein [Oligoflexus sp.]|uniref:DUF305 domain-containing protein n=1 Tax=Oligoflexus sp. TaxID=1971216 RepID=UPI002D3F1E31|nr:DUF305 domain-containing protein [Oligoflexus sp.]HYX35093.1 DUF305 domain-containing protein [Oligoflexus sp.]
MKFFAASLVAVTISTGAFAVNPPASNADKEMHDAMMKMCESMDTMPATHNINEHFVKMMIPHHQSAVDMAKAYLKEGTDPEITALAQMIIEAQKKEIDQLNTWLEKNQH